MADPKHFRVIVDRGGALITVSLQTAQPLFRDPSEQRMLSRRLGKELQLPIQPRDNRTTLYVARTAIGITVRYAPDEAAQFTLKRIRKIIGACGAAINGCISPNQARDDDVA